MKHIQHTTGRTYDAPQILDIWVESYGLDEWGSGVVTATFEDVSRRIKGKVTGAPVFSNDIGGAVLAAYDAGHYQPV